MATALTHWSEGKRSLRRSDRSLSRRAKISPRLLPEAEGTKANPKLEEWFAVDRMLVGWLRNTMSQDVGAQLLHCKIASKLWNGARELTCASTKARIMVYKTELHHTRKNGLKMEEYLSKIKSIADQLALVGAPISDEDLLLHTLNGLDVEYNVIVVKLADQVGLTSVEV
ncbi:uncharacterized protein LOC114712660 [Neltuma alba]|uniref:uncharacterized protein LOC114712660 n=1 Tax=Neltuma alba TaxID=207710 RepID=UPI0010A4464F|nr:uncharacterized protein LOC114712660 [Prosopis alba]